jgi:hypothetical protein
MVTAPESFARARMQSLPLVGGEVFDWILTETMARAVKIGLGIAWTRPTCPATGSSDLCVESQVIVLSVISTTTQAVVLAEQPGGNPRGSRASTLQPGLTPLELIRHTFWVGIVNPFREA